MKNAIEVLYYDYMRDSHPHAADSAYTRISGIKRENMRMLNESMTQEQKELLEAYSVADAKTEGILLLESFRYAFHLGAQLTAELLRSENELPK